MNDRNKFIFGLFIILVTISYGIYQWYERDALTIQANQLSTEASNLTAEIDQLKEDYDSVKVEVSAERETAAQELAVVFPTKEDLTTLTRMFDTFASEKHFTENPFFISSITYADEETSDTGDYRYVPLRISVTTSKKNLNKFLEFIETSGSLEGEVRLMSIEDLDISYPDEYGGTYEVTAEINAYFSQEI